MNTHGDDLVLLYDGVCAFCDGMVKFILKRDRAKTMTFAPLQGEFAAEVFARHPELRALDALILVQRAAPVTPGQVWVSSEAVVRVWEYIGGPWRLVALLRVVPRPLRDWAYNRFAGARYRIFGKYDACPIPTPEVRERFMA